MRRRIVLVIAAVLGTLAVFAVLGFGRIREVKGCRSLAAIVNPALDDIAAHQGKPGNIPYRVAAKRYKAVASELARFDIGIPRTEKAVDELGTMLGQAGVQAAALADALEKRDIAVATTARRELVNLSRAQKAVMKRIENDCDGP
jgi:hypothetical protein